MLFSKKKITSVEKITLRLSGMRYSFEYEITTDGDKATVAQYTPAHMRDDEGRVLNKSVVCDVDTVITLLNKINFLSWDGFYGPHPHGVLDGTMFTLDASVNGGKTVKANGSQNFPRHFRELTDFLYSTIRE